MFSRCAIRSDGAYRGTCFASVPSLIMPRLSRRHFISAVAILAALKPLTQYAQTLFVELAASQAKVAADLSPTPLIQSDHPRIRALANEICKSVSGERNMAVQIHDWVRDNIKFGIAPAFYKMNATDVLDARIGFCNTKTTLFSALLRAQGIATRTRVVDLSASVLRGLFDPGTPYVDHAITEVNIEDRWYCVDSYVVDSQLIKAARKRLVRDGLIVGYGIHIGGDSQWDGRSNNFIQCNDDGTLPAYVLRDHGRFKDIDDFYQHTPLARNRQSFLSGLMIRLGSSHINKQIESVRSS